MKRLLLLLALAGSCAFAQDLVVGDFSSFTPGAYSAAAQGAWSSATAQSEPTTFTIANVGSGTPGGQVGNGFTTFLGAPQNWSGYGYATLTGFAPAGNATPSLYLYIEDEDGTPSSMTRFDLGVFSSGTTTVSVPLSFGGADGTRVTNWGFLVSEAGNPAFAFTFDQIALTTAAIPEPATAALWLGAAAFVGLLFRNGRRRARTSDTSALS